MPLSTIRDIEIYHETRGEGPPLLFITGTGGDLRRRPSPLESPLVEHFEVLAFDQRGLGRSTKPGARCTMADYAEDAAALMALVGWDRATVVGVSFGGMVAQELALRHPARVERMVLCCTSSGGAGGSSYPLHTLRDMGVDERIRFRIGITDVRRDGAWQAANHAEMEALVAKQHADLALTADDPGAAKSAWRQLEARADHDTWERLPRLDLPVLVCGGRYDGQAEPRVVEALAGRVPGAELAFFEGGHAFLDQAPEAYAHIVRWLLARMTADVTPGD